MADRAARSAISWWSKMEYAPAPTHEELRMRTLIVSDLHLGNGGVYDAFAGGDTLPALLDRFASPPTHVVVNGDGIDFLTNDGPLQLDPVRAAEEAARMVAAPSTRAVLAAFGRVLAAGGEVTVR